MKTITIMKTWMAAATKDEQKLLAERVGTSVGMLFQWSGGHRKCSATTAGRLEQETKAMHKASKGRLPIIYRTDTCEACRGCQYAAKALGERAVVSEFPIVDREQLETAARGQQMELDL